MTDDEAKVYVNKRFKEISQANPQANGTSVASAIIRELRENHNYATLVFSAQQGGWIPIKQVSQQQDGMVTYHT